MIGMPSRPHSGVLPPLHALDDWVVFLSRPHAMYTYIYRPREESRTLRH